MCSARQVAAAQQHDNELPDLDEEVVDPEAVRRQRILAKNDEFRQLKEYSWYKSDMMRFLKYFNELLFESKLPTHEGFLKIGKAYPTYRKYERVTSYCNTFIVETDRNKFQVIGITVDPKRCSCSDLAADEVATLLHECIHAYLCITEASDKQECHGPVFMACVQECAQILASTNYKLPGSLLHNGTDIPLPPRFRNIVLTEELVIGNVSITGWCS